MKPSDTVKPHLIIMVGIPGSGKSFFAEHFADTFNAPFISYDNFCKEIFANPTHSNDEDRIVNKIANYVLDEVLKTKRTVIYEGQSNLQSDRITISKKARNSGYDPLFIWVQTETATAIKRATKLSLEKPALSIDDFNNKIKRFSPPHLNEKVIVISGKHTYTSQLKIVLKHLIQPRENSERTSLVGSSKNRNFLIR